MSVNFEVGDVLPPLKHTATPFQLFRYSAVTWNPHRIHFDEPYAREEGHAGVALHSHLRAALALRCVTEGLGPEVAGHEGRLPPAQAGLRAGRPGLHRPRDRGRGRQHDPRAHRGEPLRRGRASKARRGSARHRERRHDISTRTRVTRPIRIGNCSGFYGDRARPWPTWPEPAASTSSPVTTSPRSRC